MAFSDCLFFSDNRFLWNVRFLQVAQLFIATVYITFGATEDFSVGQFFKLNERVQLLGRVVLIEKVFRLETIRTFLFCSETFKETVTLKTQIILEQNSPFPFANQEHV